MKFKIWGFQLVRSTKLFLTFDILPDIAGLPARGFITAKELHC